MLALVFILIAYLFGSLNFAIILCKFAGLPDPRSQGSGNPGATNVLRFGGKKLAFIVILGDALKGVIPVLLARAVGIDGIALSWVALVAVLGHMYPIFFRFEGGKGVATMLGAIIALSWFVGILVVLTWIVIAALFRFSSLASIISVILLPIYLSFCQQQAYILPMIIMAVIILYRHSTNIKRLFKGEEPKIGKKK
jgi:glycerol-3-phosphate acyltransferase PlsY